MQIITRTIVAGFMFGVLSTLSVQATDNDLNILRAHLDSHRSAEAWALAEKLEPQRAGDPEFDFLYAQAALAARRPSQAIFALERVRLQRPGQEQARLLLVRAYLAAGDSFRARSELDALLASRPSEPVRNEAQKLSTQLMSPVHLNAMRGFIGFDVGYDSNVNSATDASFVNGIGGGPGLGVILAPGDRAQHDSFARLSAGYGGQVPLGSRVVLYADIAGFANALYTQTQFSTWLYQARAGASWQAGPHRLALPVSRQVFSVDHQRYSTYDAASLEWTYAFSSRQRLNLGASRSLTSYIEQPTRDVRSTGAILAWNTIAGRTRLKLSTHYRQDDPRADYSGTPAQSNASMGRHATALGLDVSHPLSPRHEPRVSVLYQKSQHDDADPVFGVVREDQYAYVVAGWDWRVRPGWMWHFDLSHAANRSTIDLYEFDRSQISLGVRHDFN